MFIYCIWGWGVKNSELWISNQGHVMADFMASYLQVLTIPPLCVPGDCRKSRRAKCPRLWALPLKPCWQTAPYRSQSTALYALIMASIRVNISTDTLIQTYHPHPPDTGFYTLTASLHLSRHGKMRNGPTLHFIYLFIYVFRRVFFSQSISDVLRKELLHVTALSWVLLSRLPWQSANKEDRRDACMFISCSC